MSDTRVTKLARVLVRYSLGLREGDLFQINGSSVTAPLLRALYREALLVGANPLLRTGLDGVEEMLFKYGSDAQIQYVSELALHEIDAIDAMIHVMGSENTKNLTRADAQKVAMRRQSLSPVNQRFFERSSSGDLRWVITLFPTHAAAQDAEMSLEDYEEFVYDAGKLNADDPVAAWQAVAQEQERIAAFLQTRRVFRLVAPGTDLTYDTGGRSWINSAGQKNFPDGEIFTSPDEGKTEGSIRFTYPAVYAGREVEQVHLTFAQGKVVQASASKGEDLLHSLLDMDEGARRLGEAAFGTNYNIQRFSRNTLFDEKIGGTIHLALGNAFPQVGGQNRSALHWDLVCDMRAGGEVYADGELVYRDGAFLR